MTCHIWRGCREVLQKLCRMPGFLVSCPAAQKLYQQKCNISIFMSMNLTSMGQRNLKGSICYLWFCWWTFLVDEIGCQGIQWCFIKVCLVYWGLMEEVPGDTDQVCQRPLPIVFSLSLVIVFSKNPSDRNFMAVRFVLLLGIFGTHSCKKTYSFFIKFINGPWTWDESSERIFRQECWRVFHLRHLFTWSVFRFQIIECWMKPTFESES